MGFKKPFSILLAAFLSCASVSTKAQSLSETFCEIANKYGQRSWQTLSQFDAEINHQGVNYYLMNRSERQNSLKLQTQFMPSPLGEKTLQSLKTKYRTFTDSTDAEKLINMIQELGRHGQTLYNVDKAYNENCPS